MSEEKYNWHIERCLMIHELMKCENSLTFAEILMKYFEGFYDKKKYAKSVLKKLEKK